MCCDENCSSEQITAIKALKFGAPGDSHWAETVSFFSPPHCVEYECWKKRRRKLPKVSALVELHVRNKRPTEPLHRLVSAWLYIFVPWCFVVVTPEATSVTRLFLWWASQQCLLSTPEIKPSDVPAVPMAQTPICLQSVVIGEMSSFLGKKKLY